MGNVYAKYNIKTKTKTKKDSTYYIEDNLDIFIRSLVVPVIVISSNGIIKYINTNACNLLGYCYGEMIHQKINMIMPQDIANNHDTYLRKYFKKCPKDEYKSKSKSKSSIIGEGRAIKALHKSGDLINIHLSVSPLKTNTDTLLIATLQDISAITQLQNIRNSMDGSMPNEIIDNIMNTGGSDGYPQFTTHENICIIFCDIVGFSAYCKFHNPQEIGEMLHELFSLMDTNIKKYNLEKIRTIGDGYFITSGVFKDYIHHTNQNDTNKDTHDILNAFLFAKEIQRNSFVSLRIGIHIGNVISGIIGKTSNQFDLFGHDVNIAARLEQSCDVDCIHVSETYYNAIKNKTELKDFNFEEKITNMKNIGEVNSFIYKNRVNHIEK